ncbi:TPA: hypothetical protein ACIDRD_004359, partial [Shigella sonnei]
RLCAPRGVSLISEFTGSFALFAMLWIWKDRVLADYLGIFISMSLIALFHQRFQAIIVDLG